MGDCECLGCCCCLCDNLPCKDLGNCNSCQCDPCRAYLEKNNGLCCCQDDPVQCCDCLADTWKEKCPSGRVYDWCRRVDCPDCCADCGRCSGCDLCTGYYCRCDCNCDVDCRCDSTPWGRFEQRGFRIG